MEIKNRIAVVTGAASGIGKAVCENLADHDVKAIGMVDMNEEVTAAADTINRTFNKKVAVPFTGNTTDSKFRSKVYDTLDREHGTVSICVPCAGITRDALAIKIDKETGQVIVVEPKGLKDFSNIGGLAIGPTGSFWALNSSGSNVDLISIDPNSGTGENRGSIANLRGDLGVFGLVAAIPEPATLITMLLGVLGFQVFVCRRFKNRR